jgi:hypothetical protein
VLHLYFHQGQLVLVEGHRGAGEASLRDLATWQQGTIRQYDLDAPPPGAPSADPQLEAALAETLREMELRGILTRAAPPVSDPTFDSRPSQPGPLAIPAPSAAPRITSNLQGQTPPATPPTPTVSSLGLPPLAGSLPPDRSAPNRSMSDLATTRTPSVIGARQGPPTTHPSAQITDPQWQLLALFLHQIVEHAGQKIPPKMAIGLMMQGLSKRATGSLILTGLAVDEHGWLAPQSEDFLARFPTYEIAQAVADLITEYESRLAQLTSASEAHSIIAEAAEPLRLPLASLGLKIDS